MMSIKDLLCDLPEELSELLFEQLNNCDYDFISLRNELTETKAALAALQVKYDKKDHENKILVRGLHYQIKQKDKLLTHVKDISVQTAAAISIGEESFSQEKMETPVAIKYVREDYEWLHKDIEWNGSRENSDDESSGPLPILRENHGDSLDETGEFGHCVYRNDEEIHYNNREPVYSTYIDFNGVEQVRFNDFCRWEPGQSAQSGQLTPDPHSNSWTYQWTPPSRDAY